MDHVITALVRHSLVDCSLVHAALQNAGNAEKDMAAFMRDCFFKDPALAAEHARSRGGRGLHDQQYGVRHAGLFQGS